jgi:hypothetical protein
LRIVLLPAVVTTALVAVIPLSIVGNTENPWPLLAFAPLAFGAFLVLAWGPLRARNVRIALHADGVVVETQRTRGSVAFDDVDEVWLDFDVARSPVGKFAWIRALRLVDRKGGTLRVPLTVSEAGPLCAAIQKRCSDPLVPEALHALREGESLTFGEFQVDRDAIHAPSWSVSWQNLALVRLSPGRVHLFRAQRVVPFRTIRLDDVPHPTVFVKVVSECAPKIEED